MDDREVYVVRVYRLDNAAFAGVVECVQGGEQRAFQDCDGLFRALAGFLSLRESSNQDQSNRENDQ